MIIANMGREIKFRIWDKINKKFWFLSDYDLLCGERDFCRYSHESIEKLKPVPQQFTGLKDKNGKEIYEGDILEAPSFDGKFKTRGVVFYDDQVASFKLRDLHGVKNVAVEGILDDSRCGRNLCGYYMPESTILGNILETPELLTKNE